jgi:outer membrane protein TolC
MFFPFIALARARRPVRRFGRRFTSIALAVGLALSCIDVAAAAMPLTLAGAQRLALERSRQLAANDMATASARDMAVAAGQLPDPVLKFGIDNLPVDGADRFSLTNDFMTMRRVGVTQELTRADKRQLRADRYRGEAEKSLAEKALNTATIQRDTALAWLDRYYAEATAAVIAEQGAQARLEMQAAEGAYRAGRGSQTDIFMARGALAAFDDRRSEIERRVRNARTMLARWVGDVGYAPLAGEPAIDVIRLDPASLDSHFTRHPQIAVLTRQEEIAETEAKLAQANEKADWSVELAYQQRGPAYSNMVSIGVSIPLQWDRKNRQDRELSSKLALVEQAKAEREEALRAHIAETRSMIDEWRNDRERIARYRRELIPLAGERTAAELAAYRGGKTGLTDVLAARRNELDVRLQALQLEADTARLWAQLNFLFSEDSQGAHAASTINKDMK